MKDYFDRTLNRMQGDIMTDEKRNYYQGVIDAHFELGFLSEYERGELAMQLINMRLAVIGRECDLIGQRENAVLFKLSKERVVNLCQQPGTQPC